jgi:GNAT superfamily N-acetyltransferase
MTADTIVLTSLSQEVIDTQLTDGTLVTLRTIQPSDLALMREGIRQLSPHSRYLRFFSHQPVPTDTVIQKLVDADGYNHIGWGALLTNSQNDTPIGAVHVFRDGAQSSSGEVSFAIVDAFHGLGLARILMAVLLINCRVAQIQSLDVHVLSENRAAANLVRTLGARQSTTPATVSDYELDVDVALDNLRAQVGNTGLQAIFKRFAQYSSS